MFYLYLLVDQLVPVDLAVLEIQVLQSTKYIFLSHIEEMSHQHTFPSAPAGPLSPGAPDFPCAPGLPAIPLKP